jgi:predicted dehydrogenase
MSAANGSRVHFTMQTPRLAISRRRFLGSVLTLGAAPVLAPISILGRAGYVPPNSRIGFGVIGVGNRARAILPNFLGFAELHCRAVSDSRRERLRGAKEVIDAHYRNQDCEMHPDFRELLARRDVDAVLIATGNRWHGLGSMYAARAGKDIYSEKPVTLTIAEGRALVETCRRFGAVYQAGTQRRNTESYAFAREAVLQGRIGRLRRVEMQCWTGPAIPHGPSSPVPDGWDYDQWLGQAPWRPFTPARVFNWQYFWDTAEGMLSDMGCHYTDQMQWVLGTDDTGPVEFEAQGTFPDPAKFCSETPVTAEARCRYANGVEGVMYQRAGFTDRYLRFIGDGGWVQVDDETDTVKAEPASILSLKGEGGTSWANASAHIRNFLDCIRSRRQTNCHPEVAHRAMTICQAMNISLRLGRKLAWDPVAERFDLDAANRMLYREPRAPWRM